MRLLGTPEVVQTTGKALFLNHPTFRRDAADVLLLESGGQAVGLMVEPGGLGELKQAIVAAGFEIEERRTPSVSYELKYGRKADSAPHWIRRLAPIWYVGAIAIGFAFFFSRQEGNAALRHSPAHVFFGIFFGAVIVLNLVLYARWRGRK
jgi:hypothetical protein